MSDMPDSPIIPSDPNQAGSSHGEVPPVNPQLLQMLGSLLGSAGNSSAERTDASQNPTESPPKDGLATLLSNPAVLERLPQIMSMLGPIAKTALQNNDPQKAVAPSAAPPIPPAPTATVSNSRDQLLLSLKPFLSPRRCEAVDTMLRIAKLGTLFQQMK